MIHPEAISKLGLAGGLAFPAAVELENPGGTPSTAFFLGMTLRDYFAAKAMPLAWKIFAEGYSPDGLTKENIARAAYELADTMLKAREDA